MIINSMRAQNVLKYAEMSIDLAEEVFGLPLRRDILAQAVEQAAGILGAARVIVVGRGERLAAAARLHQRPRAPRFAPALRRRRPGQRLRHAVHHGHRRHRAQ